MFLVRRGNLMRTMVNRVGHVARIAFPSVIKRNIGTCYVLFAKAADPIQQLFLDKIAEFKIKINDQNFVKQFPELQKNLDDELMRVTRQYGGNKPEDLAQLPPPKVDNPNVDHQPGF